MLARAAQRALRGLAPAARRADALGERCGATAALRWAGPTGSSSAASLASLMLRRSVAGPAVDAAAPEVMRKARRMSPGTGLVAGLFGSVVGVGGGVVIVPMIVGACRSIPQR
jgi:uncharacterized membrane protein YfcA